MLPETERQNAFFLHTGGKKAFLLTLLLFLLCYSCTLLLFYSVTLLLFLLQLTCSCIQLIILPFLSDQFLMITPFDDMSVVKYDDDIGVFDS